MATPSGEACSDVGVSNLKLMLEEEPFRFQFFQLVRLLKRMQPEREMAGRFAQPSGEVARFTAHQSLEFPASEIDSVVWVDGKAPTVNINFMGLTGPQGALPLVYSELVLERMYARDKGLRDFLDIFNHRIISHFYQAWEKYRFPVGFERGEHDRLSSQLLSLVGLGFDSLAGRQKVSDGSLMYYAGLLAHRPRSVGALEQIVGDYFDVPVEIDQFVGAWFHLNQDSQTCLMESLDYTERLGVGAVLGDEVWDQQSTARIRIGPLTFDRYVEFLPQGDKAAGEGTRDGSDDGVAQGSRRGSAFEQLQELVRFLQDSQIDFQLQLVLESKSVSACQLGGAGKAASHLGWTSWATTSPMQLNPRDVIIRL